MRIVLNRLVVIIVSLALSMGLVGCAYSYHEDKPSSSTKSATSKKEKEKSTPKDVFSPYPKLYSYSSESACYIDYKEDKVISYQKAKNYVGDQITVEGVPSSVYHAASSKGSPYFINFGNREFCAVVWEEDYDALMQSTLDFYVDWSKSDEPITTVMRVSGPVTLYDGEPQIVIRNGSQLTREYGGKWVCDLSSKEQDKINKSMYPNAY